MMKKVYISLFIVVAVISLSVVSITQSKQNETVQNSNEELASFDPYNWYGCYYGDYQVACDAIGVTSSAQIAPSIVPASPLSNWYGCHYGNHQPACNAINGASGISKTLASNVGIDPLSNWYGCHYGNHQPACDAIGAMGTATTLVANVDIDPLSNWYGCHYGNHQPACDAIR